MNPRRPRSGEASSPGWRWPRLLLAAAVLLSIAVSVVTLRFGFVYDDRPQILENPAVQSRQFQTSFFTRHLWAEQTPGWKGNFYRPLFLLWLQANYRAFGDNAFWWHAGTIAVHALATLLVFLFARRLLREETLAAVAALLFAVLPTHVEAVAWISGVDESLACVLFLAALLCWMEAREPGERQLLWLGLAMGSFAAAALMKENAIVLPAVVIAFEGMLGAGWSAGLRRSLPFWLVACGYLAARVSALSGIANPDVIWPLRSVLLTLPSMLWFYALRVVWPFGCSTFYDLHLVSSLSLAGFVVPLLQVTGLAGMAVVVGRASRLAGFLLLGFGSSLAPFLAATYVLRDFELVHDRYLYTPSVFLVVLAALGLGSLAEGRRRWIVSAVTAGVVALFSLGSVLAALPWKDGITLFSHAVTRAPHNPLARMRLAEQLIWLGSAKDALPLYEQAVALDPRSFNATVALASTHLLLGQFQKAEDLLQHAKELDTGPTPHGTLYYLLGMTENRMGKYSEAERALRTAVSIRPGFSQYHYELAVALKEQGKIAEARAALLSELSIFPASQAARQLLQQIGP